MHQQRRPLPPRPNANLVDLSANGLLVYALADEQAVDQEWAWGDRDGAETAITLPPRVYRFWDLSPDGTRLAYFCGNLSNLCMVEWPSLKTLFQMPISYFKPINKKPAPATAAWSLDGAWVYFSSSISGNWDIYRMRPDGSQVQNLTEGSSADELMPSAR